MVIGEPYKMAFILERMAIWEPPGDTFRNGIMFLCVSGEVYPKDVRTTTLGCEFPTARELLGANIFGGRSVKDSWEHIVIDNIGGIGTGHWLDTYKEKL